MNKIVNSSIYLHGRSFSPPLPQLPYMPLHSELWIIPAVFQPITARKGQFNLTVSGHSLYFDKGSSHWIKACVHLPFVFLIGPTFYNLEKEMATHSSILAWKIPWMEKSSRLQSMGSKRVEHD